MSEKRWTIYRLPGANWTLLADDMSLPSRAESITVVPAYQSPALSQEQRERIKDAVMAALPDTGPYDGLSEGEVEEAVHAALRDLAPGGEGR